MNDKITQIGCIALLALLLLVIYFDGRDQRQAKREAFRRGWFEGTLRDSTNWTRELDPTGWIYHSPREFTDAEIDSILKESE